eukprot:UC1_evm1s1636
MGSGASTKRALAAEEALEREKIRAREAAASASEKQARLEEAQRKAEMALEQSRDEAKRLEEKLREISKALERETVVRQETRAILEHVAEGTSSSLPLPEQQVSALPEDLRPSISRLQHTVTALHNLQPEVEALRFERAQHRRMLERQRDMILEQKGQMLAGEVRNM